MTYEIRPMSLGEILDVGFRILRNHFTTLVGLATLLYVPLFLVSLVIQREMPAHQVASPDELRGVLPVILGTLAVGLLWVGVAWPVASAAITYAVGELYLGRSATIGQALSVGWSLILPLAGTSLLMAVAVGIGLVLLVIPGVYLLLSYALLWPIMVLERIFGLATLRRSRLLMRGELLRAAGLGLVAGLLTGVLSGGVEFGLGFMPTLGALVSTIVQAAGTVFTTTISVLLYFDVRCRKEAFDLQHLARLVAERSAPPVSLPT